MHDQCHGVGSGSQFASEEKFASRALDDARKEVLKIAGDRNRGFALCPHCRMYQRFMIKGKRKARRIVGWCIGTAIGVMPIWLLMLLYDMNTVMDLTFMGLLVVSLCIAAMTTGLLGWLAPVFLSINAGPHNERDEPESMTDEKFMQWTADCEAQGVDPITYWLTSTNNIPYDVRPLSIGLLDLTGQDFCRERYGEQRAQPEMQGGRRQPFQTNRRRRYCH